MHNLFNVWNTLRTKLGFTGKKQWTRGQRNQFGRRLRMESLENRRVLAITVDNPLDELDTDRSPGDTSLREAIADANLADNEITFHASLNGATITLLLGEIEFDKDLTIDASMLEDGITIDGDDPTPLNENSEDLSDGIRIFNITDPSQPAGTSPPEVEMIGLTLKGADPFGNGGAIQSAALLTLREMVIEQNTAVRGGVFVAVAAGGSGNREVLRIEDSTIANNLVWGQGGGGAFIQLSSTTGNSQTAQIINSTLSGNTAGHPSIGATLGGALYITGYSALGGEHNAVIISSSHLVESNTAASGGAIFHNGTRVDLSILDESEISGNTASVSGGGGIHSYIFGSQLKVEQSTISGNTAALAGVSKGGGILARLSDSASLVITDSEISGNSAGNDGGGVYAQADRELSNPFPATRAITISRSLISGNSALNRGGGLYTRNEEGTEVLVEDTRITDNHVPSDISTFKRNGGGVYAYLHGYLDEFESIKPRFIITRSTVDNNDAFNNGGGIFVCCKKFGHFIASNSTISGNSTLNQTDEMYGNGGGIVIARLENIEDGTIDADLRNVTITQNVSVHGGGLWIVDLSDVRVRIANSIISENFDLPEEDTNRVANNLVGRVVDEVFKHNLVGTGSSIEDESGGSPTLDSSNDLNEDAPLLSALGNHGGPTPTHALLSGSPAIDKGSITLAKDPLTNVSFTTDQRGTGFTREFDITSVANGADGAVDIGAYEVGLAKVIDVIVSSTVTNTYGTNPPYSFADFVGSGLQLLSVPVGGADKIAVKFSEDVNIVQGDLDLIALNRVVTEPTPNSIDLPTDANHFTATWTLSGTLPGAQYLLRLDDTIEDLYGNDLDGEWTNPKSLTTVNTAVSEFPSGNGTAGGDFEFVFVYLPGDADRTNVADGLDLLILDDHFGFNNLSWAQADWTGEGSANGLDLLILDDHFGFDWRTLLLLADYDGDWDIDGTDQSTFNNHYSTGNLAADLNKDGSVTAADQTAFNALFNFSITLSVAV